MALTMVTRNEEYSNGSCLHIAIELAANKWRLASGVAGDRKIREKVIGAGDVDSLYREVSQAKKKFSLEADAKVVSCYEAGRDGFWVHRLLEAMRVENIVVDAASMKVDRRARRVKSDRVDARMLLGDLIRWGRGETDVWSVVRVPSEEEEDDRRTHRALERLKKERTMHIVRMKSLLATQGIGSAQAKIALQGLDEATTWDGSPLRPQLKDEIRQEQERLALVESQIKELQRKQREQLKTPETTALKKVEQLESLRGIGMDTAWLLVMEMFGWREFHNRREVGGAAGLGGTPYSSGTKQQEQGISKAGNHRIRTRMIEISWSWLRLQPDSNLTQWFNDRFAHGGSRMRRVGIVGLARRLLIQLWHFAEHGVVPPGAFLKV